MEIKQSIEIVIKKELNAQKELRPYVNQKKAKKCNRRVCCKHIYSFKLKNWKRIKASCKRETNCTSRKKKKFANGKILEKIVLEKPVVLQI